MSARKVVVAIEAASVGVVRDIVRDALEPAGVDGSRQIAGLRVEVVDASDEADYAVEFSKRTGLRDETLVWAEVDSRLFPTEVILEAPADSVAAAFLETLGDALARVLSQRLKTRTVLLIGDGYVSFGIFSGGHLTRFFREAVTTALAGRAWVPRGFEGDVPEDT